MEKRILIVDDSAMMRKLIGKVLRQAHQVVGEAKNGHEALEYYKTLKPDIVTMDITMRGMDGLTAAKTILEYDPKARIIVFSNLDEEKYRDQAIELGAVGFIRKHQCQDILALIQSCEFD